MDTSISLKEKILSEMTTDSKSLLEKFFSIVKLHVKIRENGTIDISNPPNYTGEQLVGLYIVGKTYSFEAGLSNSDGVTVNELINELGKSKGSILPWLKNLRDKRYIKQKKGTNPVEHYIPVSKIESFLNSLSK